jgi:hypothetical protein
MSRSIADPLYERLLSSYPAGQAYSRADLQRGPMPNAVRHFLSQLLRHQSRHEHRRLRRAGSDWVDYRQPEVRDALADLQDVLSRHARIPGDEWASALQQACRYVSAYLLRPTPVLTDFVFGKQSEALPLERIRWRMQFFQPYAYLVNAVEAYAQRKNVDAFKRASFQRFLHQIDARLTGDYSRDQWMDLLQPLLQLTETATGRDEVPIRPMITFFDDKGHERAVYRLRQLQDDGQSRIGASGLRRVLQQPRTTEERAPEAEPLRSSASTAPWDDEDWGFGTTGAEPADDEATPLWKRFQQGPPASGNGQGPSSSKQPLWAQYRRSRREGGGTAGTSAGPPSASPAPGPAADDAASGASRGASTGSSTGSSSGSSPGSSRKDPYNRSSSPFAQAGNTPSKGGGGSADGPSKGSSGNESRDASSGSSSGTSSGPSSGSSSGAARGLDALEARVFGGSNPPQRGVFVRQLFGGNLDDYQAVLERLQHAESWGEASQIIARDVFRAHKINIYSDAAVHFTNAVEQRFT